MPKKQTTKAKIPAAVPIEVERLFLDPHNPRLADRHYRLEDQTEILRVLWRERAVNELVDSIAASSFWPHEVLFATEESSKLVVIEGNRRLAAVKLLLNSTMAAEIGASSAIPKLSAEAKDKLKTLPVVICERRDVWEFIGFKHVNGPQDWDSIAKAEYIARVRNDYKVSLEEIGRTIGDRHDTVKRLYRGLMVLEQAERTGLFNRDDRYTTRFAYSHLWTGLGFKGFQDYLGLSPDSGFKPNPVPKSKLDRLKELLVWLYGSKSEGAEPLIKSQNPDLRELDEVLRSQDGVAALRTGLPLKTSLKLSRGDQRLLRESLVAAESFLREAKGMVVTGYSAGSDLLKRAENLVKLADSILVDMYEIEDEATKSTRPRGRRAGR